MSFEIIHCCNIMLQVLRPGAGSRKRSKSSALRSVMIWNYLPSEIPMPFSGVLNDKFTLRRSGRRVL